MGGETKLRTATGSYPKLASGPVAKQIHSIYRDRLTNFTNDGQYAGSNLQSKLYEGVASGSPSVELSVWSAPGTSRPTFDEATDKSNKYGTAQIGDSFGPSWTTHWFHVKLKVPDDLRHKDHLELHWDANNEGMVWTEDGTPLQGLSGNGERIEWILPESFRDGKEHIIYIEMACNGMFGNSASTDPNQPPAKDKYFMLQKADIVAVRLEARALYMDFWEIGDAAREFPEDSWEEHAALQACNKIMDAFIVDNGSNDSIKEGRKIARTYIGDNVDSEKVFSGDQDLLVTAIGQCHIDTCWLWPWAETKRKIARSWLNQCDLLDRYPEYKFAASQAQQYKWLETYYPDAFDRVKEHVKRGSFQPIGGSWVEHDTNLPCGESLVRQFLCGQRYFESHFGERSTTFWLPDTFGYSSQLPQLSRLAGMSRFFTQKLSWNNINEFPHTTFNWVALDGSQVLCHMAPDNTYTSEANWGDVQRSLTQHKSMDQDPTSLLVFGKGDGGGGPTWQHLEKLRRCRGMSDKTGRLPRVKMGDSVDDFYAKLEKKAKSGTDFVTWYGELYFELHRGTYTTQSNTKRNNRKAEILLHDIEYLATMASIKESLSGTHGGYEYPKKHIDEMWENVLLCQFHDCLPGSSIEMAYDDCDALYKKVFTTGENLVTDAVTALGLVSVDCDKASGPIVAINTLPFPRSEIIRLPNLPRTPSYALLTSPSTTGLSTIRPLSESATPTSVATIEQTGADTYTLINAQYIVEIKAGAIIALHDKHADRALVPPGSRVSQLVIYNDQPLYWQAWDTEIFDLATRRELHATSTAISESGPHRVAVTSYTPISSKSWIRTTIALSAVPPSATAPTSNTAPLNSTSPLPLEISAECEWRETQRFLKVEFPTTLSPSHTGTYASETQYGLVHRPTHFNTSWDTAKFEACAHRFADLSESNYGVSVLNDGKYGFACHGSVMRLSLLRSSKAPDGHADMGRHWMRWAVLPHKGALGSETVKAARAFNNPVSLAEGNGWGGDADGESSALFPFTGMRDYLYKVGKGVDVGGLAALLGSVRLCPVCTDDGVVLDWVKRGEDDEDVRAAAGEKANDVCLQRKKGRSVVVRLYESLGGRCRGRVLFGEVKVKRVTVVNLLEDEGEVLEMGHEGGMKGVKFAMRAFEVLSLRLELDE